MPPGEWVSEPFNMTHNMTLYLEEGAQLRPKNMPFNDWPILQPLPSYGTGRDGHPQRYASFVQGFDLVNVRIVGKNGTIDGNGEKWWAAHNEKRLKSSRGHLFECVNCTNVVIKNVTWKNAPFWTIHPIYSKNVRISHTTILNPHDSPNTDGIDPDSSTHVSIANSYISTGDDGIAIKSGWACVGKQYGKPSNHIRITNVTVISPTSAGVCIGSEMAGGVANVFVSQLTAVACDTGVRIKTNTFSGPNAVENVTVVDSSLDNITGAAIKIDPFFGDNQQTCGQKRMLPIVKNVKFARIAGKHITGRSFIMAGYIDRPFERIVLRNIKFDGKPAKCYYGLRGDAKNVTPTLPNQCGMTPPTHSSATMVWDAAVACNPRKTPVGVAIIAERCNVFPIVVIALAAAGIVLICVRGF